MSSLKATGLCNKRFGMLTVESVSGRYAKCRCDCGGDISIRLDHLEPRHNKSCGCVNPVSDRWVGRVFGRLTVVAVLDDRAALCRCDCGNQIKVYRANLPRGNTRSCGCLHRELTGKALRTHGKSGTRIYRIWTNMKTRCGNPKSDKYKWYGARGISVCDSWQSFENFYRDMGDPPSRKHTLDRVDNDGNYEPENCEWVTMKEQSRNRRPKGTAVTN